MTAPFYTGKGDSGQSGLYGQSARRRKYDPIFELLGTLDELNSWLGLCRAAAAEENCNAALCEAPLLDAQHALFVMQAQAAGAAKRLTAGHVTGLENAIDRLAERLIAPAGFCLPGGCRLSSYFDIARSVARRCERVFLQTAERCALPDQESGAAYLNRLSSLLYALVRYSNQANSASETAPNYGD